MRIAIGADHAGFELKEHVKVLLAEAGHEIIDLGTDSTEPVDYPPICSGVAREVVNGNAERGVVIGGSGQGEQLAANKVRGARASLCNDLYTARFARLHNDANVLSMGARVVGEGLANVLSMGAGVVGEGLADAIVKVWFATEFAGGRHERRVKQLEEIEAGELP